MKTKNKLNIYSNTNLLIRGGTQPKSGIYDKVGKIFMPDKCGSYGNMLLLIGVVITSLILIRI